MTSSQEPPLTRREARERERLLHEQQAPSPTPEPAPAAYAAPQQAHQPVPPMPTPRPQSPAPSAQPVPAAAPAAYATPQSAGVYGQQPSSFGAAPPAPAPVQTPFAPRAVQPPPPQPPAPARAAERVETTAPERTLTRRELRAMLDASQLGELDVDFDDVDDVDDPASVTPPTPASSTPMPASANPESSAQPVPAPTPVYRPAPAQQPVFAQPGQAQPGVPDVAEPKPVGHWTAQLNAPIERAEPFDQMLSRGGLSHGVPTTTNALILPSLPDHGPMGNPLASAGEIIATGSIDLPRSYGATGVHPSQIDSSEVDRLFDRVEDVGTGVAPVAATRAISTQGASRAMMSAPKKEGMNVPLVLAVTAGVLALGVVATLVIGAIAGLF
ncbi:hypothetical protein [Agromyces ramosus]|uniref:Uncharacterized protein n=1 Tax=Agromyces ramosus TaxID=33879 RepID=A0ABU0RDH9_9MICO|nr:hypothetical protein [Agromyces ramosus]MDQ0896128.1 hypothetical protein [Agromyces ramosus]